MNISKYYKVLKHFIIIMSIILFFISCVIFAKNYHALNNIVQIKEGVIDLSNNKYSQLKIVELIGKWEFYEGQLLTPDDFKYKNIKPNYINIPSDLGNIDINYMDTKEFNYGTYKLKVKLPDNNKVYALKIPAIYSAYNIWVNDTHYKSMGEVGTNKYTSKSRMANQSIYFIGSNSEADIIIQVSNFDTTYLGIKWPLKLYTTNVIKLTIDLQILGDIVFISIFLVMWLFFFMQYLLHKEDKKILYISFICLALFIRILFIGDGILYQVFDIYNILIRLHYIDLVFLVWANIKFYLAIIDKKVELITKFDNCISIITIVFILAFSLLPITTISRLLVFGMILVFALFYITYCFLLNTPIKDKCEFIANTFIIVFIGFFLGNVIYITDFSTIDYFTVSLIIAFCINSIFIVRNSAKIYSENKEMNKHLETLVSEKTAELRFTNEKLKNLNYKLKQKATTDSLTKLYNRRMFETLFIKQLIEKDENKKISLLIFDIDFFKNINDTYGHEVGDIVLVELATLVKSSLRTTDIIARWGGEEFVILLPYTDIRAAKIVAEKLRKIVSEYNFPTVGNITLSFGVAELKEDILSNIISIADKRLYKAKNTGRNKVVSEETFL